MTEWIELNLPYQKIEPFDSSSIEKPELEQKAWEDLGYCWDDIEKLRTSLPDTRTIEGDSFSDLISKVNDKVAEKVSRNCVEFHQARIAYCKQSKDSNIRTWGEYLDKRDKYLLWEEKQPEIIAYSQEYENVYAAFKKENGKKSFSGLGLDKPGTLIEVQTGGEVSQYLIGHINPSCGTTDDYSAFDLNEAIVLKYKVIWDPNG